MHTNKFKVLGLLSLPLLAIAVAVMVFAFNSNANSAQADTFKADGGAMTLSVGGVEDKVLVPEGSTFTLEVNASEIPQGGYILAQAWIDYGKTGLVGKNNRAQLWTDPLDGVPVAPPIVSGQDVANNGENIGTSTALQNPPASVYKGVLFTFELTCDTGSPAGTHAIKLLAFGDPVALTAGTLYKDAGAASVVPNNTNFVVDEIGINCLPATATNTPPATATPPPIPRMSKCDPATHTRLGGDPENPVPGEGNKTNCDSLVNVFLTHQGSKLPPTDCLSGTNIGSLAEGLGQSIVTDDPKGDPQSLAAFEFEVHYDSKKVCVTITPGDEFRPLGAVCHETGPCDPQTGTVICAVEDSNTKPQLEGVARVGCVSVGKSSETDPAIDELQALAFIDIYPQPDLYSEMKPNQDNGNVVQINNVNCDIGDEQGHAIALFSCDDADITFRYLEGDVNPDCVVDSIDAQAIAFRWGVTKGSLIYKDFMNLEPSNQQADSDIDINDLQFVFGRFGSECADPHPPQPAVNPKA